MDILFVLQVLYLTGKVVLVGLLISKALGF